MQYKPTLVIGLYLFASVASLSYLQILSIDLPIHAFTVDTESNTIIIASDNSLVFFTFNGWMTQNLSLPPECHAKSLAYHQRNMVLAALCNNSQVVINDGMQETSWSFPVMNASYDLEFASHGELLVTLSPQFDNQTQVSVYALNGTLENRYTLPYQIADMVKSNDTFYFQGSGSKMVYITIANTSGVIQQVTKVFYPTSGLAVNDMYIVSAGHGLYLYRLDGYYVAHVGGYTWINAPTISDNSIVYFNNMANNGSLVAATLDFIDFNGNELYSLDYAGPTPRNIHHERIVVTSTGYLLASLNDNIQAWTRQ